MKSFKNVLILSLVLLISSCFEDKSTEAVRPISEITISAIDSVYNIDKNETLVITPLINQTNKQKELSYTWEINLDEYSSEQLFTFVGKELGKFNCRLIVENEDGKAFMPFVVNVNSPYEYGITVLSEKQDGSSVLSFMQEPMKEGDVAKFTEGDCFTINNPEMEFASHPSDIIQSSGSIVVACQGDDSEENEATIYFLNEKTFVVESFVTSKEYPTFKPTKLLMPSLGSVGITYPVLSSDGYAYDIPTYNAILQPSTRLFSNYSQAAFVGSSSESRYDILLWDNVAKGIALIYNGYGPYYYGDKYLLGPNDAEFSTINYFKDVKGLVTMAMIRRTPAQEAIYEREVLVLVAGKTFTQKVIFPTFPWNSVEGKPGVHNLVDNGGLKIAGTGTPPIDENTPCIANKTYNSLLFADGNKVRRWYYTTNTQITKADNLLTVGSDKAVITSLEMSDDHLKTYVAFYEPDQEGLNGSVWVFDTDKGTVLEKHDNVCYKPVKMIYKKR